MAKSKIDADEGIQLLNNISEVKITKTLPVDVPLFINKETSTNNIKLLWRNLSYSIVDTSYSLENFRIKRKRKCIQLLNNLNGTIKSGKLTAIIGPSGAGKTTLMECLSGRKQKRVSGQIMVNYFENKTIKIAYNAQNDSLMDTLTVEETLLFASKLKNNTKDMPQIMTIDNNNNNNVTIGNNFNVDFHHEIVNNIMTNLGLKQCSNVRVSNCSGGQLKRLGIALELISSSSILLLDEPTSGLDSLSCLQCITLLKKLSKSSQPIVIIVTIHQPTARLLSYFDHLYVVSVNGQCIYNGPTQQLLPYLSQFDIQCPQYHNPADFVTEIASGDHGDELIQKLALIRENDATMSTIPPGSVRISKIYRKSRKQQTKHQPSLMKILLQRCWLTAMREPVLSWLRLSATILIIGIITILFYKKETGSFDGCIDPPSMDMIESLSSQSQLMNPETGIADNIGFVFFTVLYIGVAGLMPTLMTFPIEMPVLLKESSNGWYSIAAYFTVKSVTDLPLLFISPAIYGVSVFYITSQINEIWRMITFILILELLSLVTQSFGFALSALFVNKITAAVFAGGVSLAPFILFTGIIVRIQSMPLFVRPLTYLSFYRHAFESILITFYGFDRCPPPEQLTIKHFREEFGDDLIPIMNCIDDHDPDILINATMTMRKYNDIIKTKGSSLVMQSFNLTDNDLLFNITLIIAFTIIYRILAYAILLRKMNKK